MHPHVPLARKRKQQGRQKIKKGRGGGLSIYECNAGDISLLWYLLSSAYSSCNRYEWYGTNELSFNGRKEAVAARGHVVIVGLH